MYENTFEQEDRIYLDPTTSRDEQLGFLNTYKDIQAKNNAQIARENYNLGTPISSNLGGLGGGTGTQWKAQYQRPQTDLAIANLTTAAQQTALNQALTNYQNMLQNRYNQAKRKYYDAVSQPKTTTSANGADGEVAFEDSLTGTTTSDTSNTVTGTMVTDADGRTWLTDDNGNKAYRENGRLYVWSPSANKYIDVTDTNKHYSVDQGIRFDKSAGKTGGGNRGWDYLEPFLENTLQPVGNFFSGLVNGIMGNGWSA